MAEVVGLMASVIAVAGLADNVLKFVKNARSWARDLKTVRDELCHSIHDVGFAANNISIAQSTLRSYCSSRDIADQSAVINFMQIETASGYVKTKCSSIKDHVEWLESKIHSLLDISWTPIVTWKWRISLKDEVEALRSAMYFILANLNLVLNCIHLEMAMKRDNQSLIEIDHLKQIIKQDEKVIRRQQKHRSILAHEAGTDDFSSSVDSLLLHEVDLLLKLARAVRRTGTAPEPSSRPSPPAARASTRSSPRIPISRLSVEDRAARSSALPSPAPEQDRPASSSRDSLSTDIERRQTLSLIGNDRVSSRSSSGEDPWPKALSVAESTTSKRLRPGPGPSGGLASPPSDIPTVVTESAAINNKPSGEMLRMVASENYQRFLGQIERRDGSWQHVTGILEPEQTFNFMTDFRASKLGLLGRVHLYTGEDGQTCIETLSGKRIRPTGTLWVKWRVTSQPRPISVLFWVFPYGSERDLVLGEPFVRKRDSYRGRETDWRQQGET